MPPESPYATDPYLDPATGILRNLLSLTSQEELDRAEREFTWLRQQEIADGALKSSRFNIDHLKAIHLWLFQDVYPWAGEIRRKVDITKGQSTFMPVSLLLQALGTTFNNLHSGPLLKAAPMSDETFIGASTDLLSDLNYIHPFREGNGRTQRVFLNLVAAKSGRAFDWRKIGERENINASIADFNNPGAFRDLLASITVQASSLSSVTFTPTLALQSRHASPRTVTSPAVASGTCPLCGRRLTSAKSLERGYGPSCWKRANG